MTPHERYAVSEAVASFASAVIPAVHRMLDAELDAAVATRMAPKAADAALVAAEATVVADQAAVFVVEAATRVACAAAHAAAAGHAPARAMADAVQTAVREVRAADAGTSAARLAEAVSQAERAVVAALGECERSLTWAAPSSSTTTTTASVEGGARGLGWVPRRLVGAAVAALPAADRARFGEEWVSLLVELPTRRARARQLCSLLGGAPRQGWVLRGPRTERA